jgi:ATP-binding cassette subfamily G (WHITE) protein 2 (SNQ2)
MFCSISRLTDLQSGAGKTTLLDVISQRKTSGLVEGTFSIGTEPLDGSFSRRAGFCMQADIHDSYAT